MLEYQDYLLAYRLRAHVGGRLRPPRRELTLPEYAAKRMKRQQLAGSMLRSHDYRNEMRQVDALTDELNFGFWHNPGETIVVLRRVVEAGGTPALESEAGFVDALLTRAELARIGPERATALARYYLGLVRASASYLDPEIFTRLRNEIEPLRTSLPQFIAFGEDVTSA